MRFNHDDQVVILTCLAIFAGLWWFNRRRPSLTAYGTAAWASDALLRAAGMFAGKGLVLGRSFGGKLLHLPEYCHLLLVGGTGSGKGVSIITPALLSFYRGSVFCFDMKGDLYATTAHRRAANGQRIIRIAPFNGGTDALNPLDAIPSDSPLLVDSARALAEALVVRQGTEPDPYWNEKAVQVICALLVLVLLVLKKEDRNLGSVQDIASDPDLLKGACNKLRELGGIPARLGNQLKTLFDKQTLGLTKEGAGVLNTVSRHLSFLDSGPVAKAMARSTFDLRELQKPGITLYLQIPGDQLDAQKGFLRCIVSSLVRVIGANGNERDAEVLMLLDEASGLYGLPAIEEALVRGRSAGVRMLLAYQSDSQVRTAFRDKPTLLYDNCSVQIYLGAASSYETAERISKSLGDWTQVVESSGVNESQSWQSTQQGGGGSRGSSQNYSQSGRALMRPEEVLTMNNDYLIAFVRGMAPILAKRIKWYADRAFNPVAVAATVPPRRSPWWWLAVAVFAALYAWAIYSK